LGEREKTEKGGKKRGARAAASQWSQGKKEGNHNEKKKEIGDRESMLPYVFLLRKRMGEIKRKKR